jgi:NIPSNAP protein
VIYRMRTYQAETDRLDDFHKYFRQWLLPVQVRHGARLVGRWETDDGRVVAIWGYDSRERYELVDSAVRADPDAALAREHRAALGRLFTEVEETFMRSTV